ncbi:Trm112 family protein [Nocardioides mangrovicus]|uniref:Trm112 family protein n=1 Tax=Nocardioides mangrovicus TaxID=2478913 RepID=A0A3L8P457_9ACTN|nr:Trm112 family protein [Nocardioides mangrovicus]RLV49901.1 Trm112 family protein [Nocardioides mangrovicus]
MNLDPQLLEIVVCPHCRGALRVDEAATELVCTDPGGDCGYAYPVHTDPQGDIPILLVDEARKPA